MSEYYACGSCGRPVDPTEESTVFAYKQIETTSYGSAQVEFIDGEGVLYHGRHWQGDSRRLKRRDRPPEFGG